MSADNYLRSYGDGSRVEDVVLNTLEYLTAEETQIFNMLGKTQARDTIHIFQTDTLKTAAANAQTEAGDYTMLARTTPSNLTNIVQNIAIPYSVSRTQQRIKHYHGENELERQTMKALKEWANDAEFNLVRQTLTSGVSGTAPTMSGVIEATSKSTNHTSHNSGTVWNSTILDALMKNNWDNSTGDVATDLFMGSFLRKATDEFTEKTNVVVNSGDRTEILRTVSSYTTAFGTLRIHTHRYIQQSGTDSTGRVLAINPEKLKVAMLEAPFIDTGLARSGDYDKRAVVGKFTLETRNQDANWYADGFDID